MALERAAAARSWSDGGEGLGRRGGGGGALEGGSGTSRVSIGEQLKIPISAVSKKKIECGKVSQQSSLI